MTPTPIDPFSPSRIAAVRASGLLDTPPELVFDRVTRIAEGLLCADTVLFSLVDSDRQFFKSACGLPEPWATARETALTHSFCKHVVVTDEPLIVEDARTDPRVTENLAVRDLGVIAYLGVPVRDPSGERLGALCAIGTKPRPWSAEEIAAMSDLAAIVENELTLRAEVARSGQLAEENEILAREYHHRVKNALTVAAWLVSLAGRESRSVEELVQMTCERLSALSSAHDALLQTNEAVDLRQLANKLLCPYGPQIAVDIGGSEVTLAQDQVTPICLVLHELATNSAKYGALSGAGVVAVRWSLSSHGAAIDWTEQAATISRPPVRQGFGSALINSPRVSCAGRAGANGNVRRCACC